MTMKSPSSFRSRLRALSGATLIFAAVASACGPDFPNCYLLHSEGQILAAPIACFAAEIARLPKEVPTALAEIHYVPTPEGEMIALDLRGVREALAERGMLEAPRAKIVEAYTIARRRLAELANERSHPPAAQSKNVEPEEKIELPAGLPQEFALYFAGAVAWRCGDPHAAGIEWRKLMDLPEVQRRHRSVWAAYMMGRAWMPKVHEGSYSTSREALQEAVKCFRLTRELGARGFPDPLGLAVASVGWEARAALELRDYPTAIELYFAHYVAGDPSALESLRTAAKALVSDYDPKLTAAAKRPMVRRVVTAYFTSRSGSLADDSNSQTKFNTQAKSWAEALAEAGVRDDAQEDRLAWVAYESALFPLAQQWLAVASEKSPATQWLRAKLALRRGDLAGGEKFLRDALAIEGLDREHRAVLAAELGRVCLARDNFAGALSAALAGNHWQDAAFVAEHVMTTGELRAFVDARPPVTATKGTAVPATPGGFEESHWWLNDLSTGLRSLLARRLAREGKVDDAEEYFPADLRPAFHGYVGDVRVGFDVTRPVAERAAAFWRAAHCVRERGEELLGTELEPDWGIWGNEYDYGVTIKDRSERLALEGGLFAPTANERKRLAAHPAPEKRFHYRYRAADLAWWAASLLPNDSDETAKILNDAGGWLKWRDPAGALRFYQALVIRCGNTTLGRAAAQQHWFPREKEKKPEL